LATVEDFNLQDYDFTEDGVGCRYWATEALRLLQARGLVHDDLEQVIKALDKAWMYNGESAQVGCIPIQVGTFHDRTTHWRL